MSNHRSGIPGSLSEMSACSHRRRNAASGSNLLRSILVFSALTCFAAGCGSSLDGYVDYRDTAPISDAAESSTAAADTSSAESSLEPSVAGTSAAETSSPGATGVHPDSGRSPDRAPALEAVIATAGEQQREDEKSSDGPSSDRTPEESTTPQQPDIQRTGGDSAAVSQPLTQVVVTGASGLDRTTAGAAEPDGPAPGTGEPRTIELLITDKSFRKEKDGAVRVTYDDIDLLKILNMEPVPVDAVDYFPDWLKQLDGKHIRIRGFMYPTFEATGLTVFTLARDNGICCFVRQPRIYDIIAVELASGVTTDYIEGRPFDVEGVFRIQPEADDTELYRLYRIENARVLR